MCKTFAKPLVKQCYVTTAICLVIISQGFVLGFPGILLPQLHQPDTAIKTTVDDDSWITSITSFAMIVGIFIMPPISGRYGRKMALYSITGPTVGAWMVCAVATTVPALLTVRIVHGLSVGMMMSLRSAVIGEYTSPRYRGAFLTLISLTQAFGIFLVHLLGSIIHWQTCALIGGLFSYISFIMIMFAPESPSFLASKGRIPECRVAFQWLRGDYEDEELEAMIKACSWREKEGLEMKRDVRDWGTIIKQKEFYKPIIIMIHAYFLMQFSGGPMIANFSTVIIKEVAGPEVNVNFWMVFLDSQRLISNAIAVFALNKTRRRPMLFFFGILSVTFHLAISAWVYLRNMGSVPDVKWIPLALINVQVFALAVGTLPLPIVLAGEVFPLEYRSIGSSTSVLALALSMFAILKTFLGLVGNIGIEYMYLVYAGIVTYSLVVMWFWLPETKGKTLQQIEEEFRGRPFALDELAQKIPLNDPVEDYKREELMRRCSSIIL